MAEAEGKRRPVLVVTRSAAIPVLTWLVVAPVTRRTRRIPTAAIPFGEEEGLSSPSSASFDNLQPIRRRFLTERVGTVVGARVKICHALGALADC